MNDCGKKIKSDHLIYAEIVRQYRLLDINNNNGNNGNRSSNATTIDGNN